MDALAATAQRLVARADDSSDDGATRSLSGGAIAGIVIGIVVVAGLLAALLIWRMYTYKTNRDFFTGRPNVPYASQVRQRGHVRSTRGRLPEQRESIVDIDGVQAADYGDEKRLVGDAGDAHIAHSHIDLGHSGQDNEAVYLKAPEGGYPSETNRASWWWRPQRLEQQPGTSNVENEVMQPYNVPSSTVGNVAVDEQLHEDPYTYQPDPNAAHPAAQEAEQAALHQESTPAKSPRASFRQGCTTQ